MRPLRLRHVALAFCLALLGALQAHAADENAAEEAPTAADMAAMQAVRNFRLTDGFIENWISLQTDTSPASCKLLGAMMSNKAPTLDAKITELDADTDVRRLLAAHHLSAREAILGWSNLMGAAAVEMQQKMAPGQPVQSIVSAENLKFYRAHQAQMHQRMQAAAKADLAANHGKIRCLSTLNGR